MRLYAQRAFLCRECDLQVYASEPMDAVKGTYYGPGAYGQINGTQMLEAADAHYAETGHATYREENRLIYQPA